MLGILSWLAFGLIAGLYTSRQMAGRDLALILFTTGVGIAGSLVGGLAAALLGVGGGIATFSLYSLFFAAMGAGLTLLSYRRFLQA